MSLITETGSGAANSESYASVAYADTYHSDRGNAAWALLATPAKEQALRKGTDYLTQSFRSKWKGYRSVISQSLDWPRQSVYIDDNGYKTYVESTTIPAELKNACCELALRSLTDDLSPDIERQTSSESIGSLSVTYEPGSSQSTQFKSVEMMLKPLLKNGGSGIQLIRA